MADADAVENFFEKKFQDSKIFLENGDYQSAIKSITDAINLAEKFQRDEVGYYYFYRANIYYDLKDYDSAEKDYKKAINLLGRYEEYECGVANFRLKNYKAAVENFQIAIQNDIGSWYEGRIISPCEIMVEHATIWDSCPCSKIYKSDEKGFYLPKFELCPLKLATNLTIGKSAYDFGTLKINSNLTLDENSLKKYNLEELLNYLTELIEQNPNSSETAEIYNLRGQIYFNILGVGHYYFIDVESLKYEPEEKLNYSKMAIEDFNRAVKIKPDCLHAYMNLGWVYFYISEYELAIENYSKALEICPYNPVAYYYLAYSTRNYRHYPKALEDYEKAYKFAPWVNIYLHKFWLMRAIIADTAELKESVKKFNRFIKKHPDNFKGYFKRGKCYQELQDYELAVADFTMAIKLNPNNFRVYFGRSECFRILEDWKRSEEDYNIAQRLIQQAPEVAKYTEIIENAYSGNYSHKEVAEAHRKRAKIYESWNYYKLAERDINWFKNYEAEELISKDPEVLKYTEIIEKNYSGGYSYRDIAEAYRKRGEIYKFWEYDELAKRDLNWFKRYFYEDPKVSLYSDVIENPEKHNIIDVAEAYYKRGKIYESWGYNKLAQSDFDNAKKLGYEH